jgi:glutamate synthase domain-containing protein 3
MSGGVAYVWDRDGHFKENCNLGNVTAGPLGESDIEVVRELLKKHLLYTGSVRAQALLDDFATLQSQFVMLVPNGYKRIMDAIDEAEQAGVPADERALYAFNTVIYGKAS